jgi:hypothetical protein
MTDQFDITAAFLLDLQVYQECEGSIELTPQTSKYFILGSGVDVPTKTVREMKFPETSLPFLRLSTALPMHNISDASLLQV